MEFDRDDKGTPIPKEQQFAAVLASGLPVSALLDSGNKSLHAWVRMDAPDATEWRDIGCRFAMAMRTVAFVIGD